VSSVGERAFGAVLYALGAVATGAGLDTAVRGERSYPGRDPASVESEARFYGGIYAGYGLTTLAVAARADRDEGSVRAVALPLFLAGLARASGWAAAGRPTPLQRGLLALELALPPLLVAWRSRL
jgi:hypothetical protein